MIKHHLFFLFFFCVHESVFSQEIKDSINENDAQEIIAYLASDSLKGRGNYTPELNKAAHFIANKFAEDHLEYFPTTTSYFLPFTSKTLLPNQKVKDTSGHYDPNYILQNVVGVLRGKVLSGEIIIFCAHYDHLSPLRSATGDSIFNGANDNASGTTALLMLANYFSKRDNNRSLIFLCFCRRGVRRNGIRCVC